MINCIDSYRLINPNIKYYENLQDCSRQFKLLFKYFVLWEKKKERCNEDWILLSCLGKKVFTETRNRQYGLHIFKCEFGTAKSLIKFLF